MKIYSLFCIAVLFASGGNSVKDSIALADQPALAGQTGRAPVNGIELYYETYGKGSPLLLLHGGFHDVNAWRGQIPELSKYFRVIAVDTRGHGASTDADQPLSYQLLTDDIIGLMNYLRINQADVVGWSDGAVIAILMSVYHPSRINRAVLIGATVQFKDSLKPFYQWFMSSQLFFKLYADTMLKGDYPKRNPHPENWPVFRDKVNAMWQLECYLPVKPGEDCLEPLSRITAPTLILVGEDEMIRLEHTEVIHRAIPNSKLMVIDNADHFVAIKKPREVNQAILDFLNRGD